MLLAAALIGAWEYGARTMGKLFFAPPLEVLERLGELVRSGQVFTDILATLRVSVLGFAIAAVAGVLLPFLLRRSPRATEAVEPYIMASMGIPKYALAPWLILWFGIGDLPKLVVVTLVVFYILFITTFAGIRGVDQRLIKMARIIGASEQVISREIIWTSLLPFFFTGLKIAFPRAVSATIVGEFLVVDGRRRPLYRARAAGRRHHRRVRRHRRRDHAGAGDQRAGQPDRALGAALAPGRTRHGTVRGQANETRKLYRGRRGSVRRRAR